MIPLGPTSRTAKGQLPGLGCQPCELLSLCGGFYDGFDCLGNCCGEPENCTTGCFRSKQFVTVVRDSGGLHRDRVWNIRQSRRVLPEYVPHIHNGYGRSKHLSVPCAALTTFDVVKVNSGPNIRTFSDAAELRQHFRISPKAKIILLSIARDDRLERYWQYEESSRLPEQLANLRIEYVTAPNYSFPLNVPRPDHLLNRMRSLRSAERLSIAGIKVIPHLNSYNETDWNFWRDFLKEHPHISLVALEFQTGLASPRKAAWHVCQLYNIQEALGRRLHLIAVAGRRHLSLLAGFSNLTVIDSVPFVRACKRQVKLDRINDKWAVNKTLAGSHIDDLFRHNVSTYAYNVKLRMEIGRKIGPIIPRLDAIPEVPVVAPDFGAPISPLQRSFWGEEQYNLGAAG